MALGNGHDRAIVIIRDRTAVKPFMERRANLGCRHEQPDKQRQKTRRAVQIFPRSSAHFEWHKYHVFKQSNQQSSNCAKPSKLNLLIANRLQFDAPSVQNKTYFPLFYRMLCQILTPIYMVKVAVVMKKLVGQGT